MNARNMHRFAIAIAASVLFAIPASQAAQAQSNDDMYSRIFGGKPAGPSEAANAAPAPGTTGASVSSVLAGDLKENTMAVVPWILWDGTQGAQQTTRDLFNRLMARAGMTLIYDRDQGESAQDHRSMAAPALPTPEQLIAVGERTGARYVFAGRAQWHSYSVWVSLGPKTKSRCTIDALIVDARDHKVVLDARNVTCEDTAKETMLQTLGTVFVSYFCTVVSGGPKTPHEQHAAANALVAAMQPWLEPRLKGLKGDTGKPDGHIAVKTGRRAHSYDDPTEPNPRPLP